MVVPFEVQRDAILREMQRTGTAAAADDDDAQSEVVVYGAVLRPAPGFNVAPTAAEPLLQPRQPAHVAH